MSLEVLGIETGDGVATLWLNRPERHNAMGAAFWEELPEAVREIENEAKARGLPGIVGKGIAYEICLTGDDVDANRAREIQLVNAVYPDAETCLAAARSMATRMAARSPIAVQGTKQVLRYCEDKSVRDGLEYVATWSATFLQSEDLKEALRAFSEKREPNYRGS